MKSICFLCCFFIVSSLAQAQENFPASFVGHWQGNLSWYKAGATEPQQVLMQLMVKPTDSANTYTWQIIYGDKSEDNRPYILKPVDTAKGHWQIDERNGIIIDQYWVGQRFTSAFTVQTNTIVCSYYLQGDNLVVEFNSISSTPATKTGKGTADSPAVSGYAVKSFQQAVLRKVAQRKNMPVKPLMPDNSQGSN